MWNHKLDLKTCSIERLRAILSSYVIKLNCGTTRFGIEGFDLNLHIDGEFALRDCRPL